jgi:hypothetical protein
LFPVREIIGRFNEGGKQYFPFGKFLYGGALSKSRIPDREIQVNATRLLTRQKSISASVTTGFPAITNQQVRNGRQEL